MSDHTIKKTLAPELTLVLPNTSSDMTTPESNTPDNSETEIKLMESTFSAKELAYIDSFFPKIDIMDRKLVLQYGKSAQSKIAKFSDSALKKFQGKGLTAIVEIISELLNRLTGFSIDTVDFTGKSSWKIKRMISNLRTEFAIVAKDIDSLASILEDHILILMQDISVLEKLYNLTTLCFKELSMYILAGKKRLFQLRTTRLVELSERANKTGAPEDILAMKDFADACDRFEKKLQDLQTSRIVAMQMATQIQLLTNSDSVLQDKIQSTLNTTIPLWKSQMLIALGLANSANALHTQREATNMTNRMIKHNSEKLKSTAGEIARESNRGIVDLKTLKETHQSLIATIIDVQRVQEEGHVQRSNAESELHLLEEQMKRELSKL